jgi:hypothetical protein
VDKSVKQRILLANEWWPGGELNTRHADFQGVTRDSCNHLTQLDVANAAVFPILRASAFAARLNPVLWPWFATANHSSGGAS